MCSRKEPDGHTCACFRHETARHSSNIFPGLKSGEVSVRVPVHKLGKKIQLCNRAARLADTAQFTNCHSTPSSTSTFRRYLQFSLIQPTVDRGCPTIVNSVATSKHAPVTCIMLKVYMTFTRPVIRTAYHADEKRVNWTRYITGKCGTQISGKVRKIYTSHFCTLWKRTPWRHLKLL